jgi:hypothetical protein
MVGLTEIELVTESPEADVFRCPNSHAFPDYLALMRMNPDKIKLIPMEKMGPHDVKVEVFVNSEIWDKFKSMYPNQVNATVQSILSLFLYGEPIIIDGNQAKALRGYGVRSGAEMVAAIEVGRTMEAQLTQKTDELGLIQDMLEKAGIGSRA